MKTGAFFGSTDGIGQFDCILELVPQMLDLTSSSQRAFNPIAPIGFDERCRELPIDEQPVFGVPIRRRDFTLDSKIIVPRPAIARHRWRSLRAIRRIVPWAVSAWLEECQHIIMHTFGSPHATHPLIQALGQVALGSAPIGLI